MTKKVRMIKTERGCPDGINVKVYENGKDYVIPDVLANIFVNQMKVAIEVVHSTTEEKMIMEAPSNKSVSKIRLDPAPITTKKPRIRVGRNRKT